ncbi:hypothetical protein [Rhodococcus sp. NPDC060176]|uniref:hypothetical protein n=1 Tax=Rhodococcus sp. NPDC060176 TaxID=3347062 RepID=UPI0036623443
MSTSSTADYVLLIHLFDQQIQKKGDPVEYRRHHQGDVVTLDSAEARRLLKAKAIAPVEEDSSIATEEGDSQKEPATGGDTNADAERPANTATTAEWVEYAVSQGFDRSDMEKLKRAEIIAAVQ